MKQFTVTEEHITLLRSAYVRWEDCEFGAPAIDCKRPYGNSDVVADMAEILGVETVRDRYGEDVVLEKDAASLTRLHRETVAALQIILATGSFEPGTYVADDYRENWRLDDSRHMEAGDGN